ncbi:hypothetical protein LTR56_027864 [Elasticomyces elasticus]|nr:hypothetical protein LTR56_027864 [Elasticomyces elasticus]KAK3613954.1 hypothetical protein LTR22_027946 [Elasticomyces elasticus]
MVNPPWTRQEYRYLSRALRLALLARINVRTKKEFYTFVAKYHTSFGGCARSWKTVRKHAPRVRSKVLDERWYLKGMRQGFGRQDAAEVRREETSFWIQCMEYERGLPEPEWKVKLEGGEWMGVRIPEEVVRIAEAMWGHSCQADSEDCDFGPQASVFRPRAGGIGAS